MMNESKRSPEESHEPRHISEIAPLVLQDLVDRKDMRHLLDVQEQYRGSKTHGEQQSLGAVNDALYAANRKISQNGPK